MIVIPNRRCLPLVETIIFRTPGNWIVPANFYGVLDAPAVGQIEENARVAHT